MFMKLKYMGIKIFFPPDILFILNTVHIRQSDALKCMSEFVSQVANHYKIIVTRNLSDLLN